MASRFGLVSIDPSDNRVFASDLLDFCARRVNGVWEKDKTFSADDFKDNFDPVLDVAEAKRLLNEAKASLSV